MSAIGPLRRAAIRRPLPSTGSRGSVPPLHRYYGALRLPAAPPALRFSSRGSSAVRSVIRSPRRRARHRGAWGFVDRCPDPVMRRRRPGLPGSWGTPLCPCPALRPRWDRHARPSRRVGAAFRYFDGVGSHHKSPFGAQSHGLRTRCLRFASSGYPGRRKTRFRLLASFAGRDWLPAGFHTGFQSFLHLIPPAQAWPGTPKPETGADGTTGRQHSQAVRLPALRNWLAKPYRRGLSGSAGTAPPTRSACATSPSAPSML